MRVIVGLGNPGPAYRSTRHNVGFWVVDRLAERWGVQLSDRAFLSLVGEAMRHGIKLVLVQPQTYMNQSGEAVARICDFYRLERSHVRSHVMVVHDDLDLPLGQIRIKRGGGGAGGNRGVASVIDSLGSKEFTRLKIGIGRPPGARDPAKFVLQPFTQQEEAFILPAIERAVEAVEVILSEGEDKAMAIFNRFNSASQTRRAAQAEKEGEEE